MLLLIFSMLLLTFTKTKHPMIVCLILVLAAAQTGIYLNKCFSKWLFYLLILLFLGGMMVLFIYMASLSSKSKPNLLPSPLALILSCLLLYSLKFYGEPSLAYVSSKSALSSLYSSGSGMLLLFLMSYLLILLLICLKLMDGSTGAMKNSF